MHSHTGALLGEPSLLHVAVTCAVLAATLFALRQLAGEWARLHSLATPLAQVGMGAVMVYTMLLPGAQPPIIGIVALLVLAGAFCHRALLWWTSQDTAAQRSALLTPGMVMAVAMALMFLEAQEASPVLRVALLLSLLGCAAVYVRSMVTSRRADDRTQWASGGIHLTLTVGMVAMFALP
jgi:uncharacterized membrane protein YfcA